MRPNPFLIALLALLCLASLALAEDPPIPSLAEINGDTSGLISDLEEVQDGLRQLQADLARLQGVAVPQPTAPRPTPPVPSKSYVSIVDQKPGHWSVASAGSVWNPTKAEAIAHLRQTHAATAKRHEPLESLSLDAILTLHDDAHEGRASVATSISASAKSAPVRTYSLPVSGGCPGGVCPANRSYSTGRGFFGWRR